MKYLEENILYTNEEMADWFKIKPNTFRANKRKKLMVLQEFAEFEEEKGKIRILKVYEAEYKPKSRMEKMMKIYEKYVVEEVEKDSLQTGVSLGKHIFNNHKEELSKLGHKAESTVISYATKVLKTMFKTDCTHGWIPEKVWSERLFNEEINFLKYREMKGQELQDWKDKLQQCFTVREEVYELLNDIVMLKENPNSKKELAKITSPEFLIGKYLDALTAFKAEYGYRPMKVNRCQLSAF